MTKHPLETSAESAGEFYYPTPVTPEEAFQAIGRLRKEARDEIDRLIRFLDETDGHMEREPDGTEDDQDDEPEDTGDDEPSLGSSGHGSGGPISYLAHAISDGSQMVYDCEGDEHDGAEDENEHGDGSPDDEPSLGWTIDGCMTGGTRRGRYEVAVDLEAGQIARAPQNRTDLGRGVYTESGWCGNSRLKGLTEVQREAMRCD